MIPVGSGPRTVVIWSSTIEILRPPMGQQAAEIRKYVQIYPGFRKDTSYIVHNSIYPPDSIDSQLQPANPNPNHHIRSSSGDIRYLEVSDIRIPGICCHDDGMMISAVSRQGIPSWCHGMVHRYIPSYYPLVFCSCVSIYICILIPRTVVRLYLRTYDCSR